MGKFKNKNITEFASCDKLNLEFQFSHIIQ